MPSPDRLRANPPRRFIDLPREWFLRTEIELDIGEICFFPIEVALHRRDNFDHRRGRGAGCGTGGATPQQALRRVRALCRQLESDDGVPFQAMLQKPFAVSKITYLLVVWFMTR